MTVRVAYSVVQDLELRPNILQSFPAANARLEWPLLARDSRANPLSSPARLSDPCGADDHLPVSSSHLLFFFFYHLCLHRCVRRFVCCYGSFHRSFLQLSVFGQSVSRGFAGLVSQLWNEGAQG